MLYWKRYTAVAKRKSNNIDPYGTLSQHQTLTASYQQSRWHHAVLYQVKHAAESPEDCVLYDMCTYHQLMPATAWQNAAMQWLSYFCLARLAPAGRAVLFWRLARPGHIGQHYILLARTVQSAQSWPDCWVRPLGHAHFLRFSYLHKLCREAMCKVKSLFLVNY